MSTPLDKIFEEAVNNCYSDFGWLDTYRSSDKGKPFNISDFVNARTRSTRLATPATPRTLDARVS